MSTNNNNLVTNTSESVTNEVSNWTSTIQNSMGDLLSSFATGIPNILSALILLLIGWVIARVLRSIITKVLQVIQFEKVLENKHISGMLEKVNAKGAAMQVIPFAVYWSVFLTFILAAANKLGIDSIETTINSLINFIPNIITALIVLLITLFVGGWVSNVVSTGISNMDIGKNMKTMIPRAIYAAIATFGVITAVNQLGIDISIITNNLTMIITAAAFGLALAGGLAFGLGGKEHAKKMLDKWM